MRMAKKLTYKSSGVDIAKADEFIRRIKPLMQGTMDTAVLKRTRAFGSLLSFAAHKYRRPVLVASADGVGTKLLVAQMLNKHDSVGIDLVGMNVNDVLCVGAKPLFFLDYIACGQVKPDVLQGVIKGIAAGCRQSRCSLIGGETAEMPGMYKKDEYDLAGFAVGVVEHDKIIDGSRIKAGDQVIGLASNGLHSNGFSLVRKVFSLKEQKRLAKELLKPTRIYVREVLQVIADCRVQGIAHITGGAFYEKMTKILPPGKCFAIQRGSWPVPKIFQTIQEKGKISDPEMFRTFNMGIGMVLVVPAAMTDKVRRILSQQRVTNYLIGEVIRHPTEKIQFLP
jgi:phosphoribosylformylglycinamidine cyclo-ligase